MAWGRIPCFDHKIDLCIRDMEPKPARDAKPATALKQGKAARAMKIGCPSWVAVWAPVAALNLRFARSGKTVRAYMRKWASAFGAERPLLPLFAVMTRWCIRFYVIIRVMEMWFVGEDDGRCSSCRYYALYLYLHYSFCSVCYFAVKQMTAAEMGFDGPSAGSDWLRLKTAVENVMPILPDVARALEPLMVNTLFFEKVRRVQVCI